MLAKHELKSLGIGSALVLVNIALMLVFARTFLVDVFNYVWSLGAIIGIIAYAVPLIAGSWLGRKGIEQENLGLAGIGISLLMLAYGSFGAGVIGAIETIETQVLVLAVTALITTLITTLAGLYVYWTDRNLNRTGYYSNIAFLGVFLTGFIGTFFLPLLILTFLLAFTGFVLYLIYEVWRMKTEAVSPELTGLGLYIAYAGVFIHVLQIVARYYIED